MRGIRVDLEHRTSLGEERAGRTWAADSRDSIYVEEEWLPRLREAIREITASIDRPGGRPQSRRLLFGSAKFWDRHPHVDSSETTRHFNAAHYTWDGTTGVWLSGFWFEGRAPAELEALLSGAISALTDAQ
jgi:hypothetical protein